MKTQKRAKNKYKINAVSLFSCIGVAECYLKDIGINVITASDIDPDRCKVYKYFYPDTKVICGDISDEKIKESIKKSTRKKIDLVISTPPCQGMSSVGKNRKYSDLNSQKDKRNFLILESFEIIDYFSPSYVIFENVPRLLRVIIPFQGKGRKIEEILNLKYGEQYNIKIDILNTCNFGIPQNRERVYIRMYKKGLRWDDPKPNERVITLREAIGDLPSLEAGEDSGIKNHWARKHPQNQIECMRHTPTGCSAVDNKVFYPKKPNGERIKSYKNCYKRVEWDKPSPTITMRNEIISSQDKVHPGRSLGNGLWSDARVFTMRELLIIMSMPPDMDLPDIVSNTKLRQFIGEGIPPKMLKELLEGIYVK